ncbi:protein artichoke-like [Ctenocephalides felis]|uniref:protein artichoke-like n=1 Tax=Ctenocephalides felis TaxID=7515 RepID=UPI000E6E346D|nr:protein artichoke-like [Ctenocephalides felis]
MPWMSSVKLKCCPCKKNVIRRKLTVELDKDLKFSLCLYAFVLIYIKISLKYLEQNAQPQKQLSCSSNTYYNNYGNRYNHNTTCLFATKSNIIRDRSIFQNVDKLYFEDSNIQEFQRGIVDQYFTNRLKLLNLANVQLENIEVNALSGLKQLQYLYLNDNIMQKLSPGIFAGLDNLQYLNLSQNQISESLDKRNFTGIESNLKTLDLSYNRINFIRKNCFAAFSQLAVLNISHNHLSTLPSFSENMLLDTIILSYNNISKIEDDTFPKKYSITTIDLSNNNLSVPSIGSVLNNFKKISSLKLGNNYIKDIEKILSNVEVNQLSIENNPIDSIAGGSFCSELVVSHLNLKILTNISLCNTGTVIKASHNNLEQMPVWTDMQEVKVVELQHNQISKIPLGIFKDLKSLNVLRLDRNKIEFLDTGVFSGLRALKSLNLSFNALSQIDHHILFGMKNLEDLYLGGNRLTTLPHDDMFKVLPSLKNLGLNKNHWYCLQLMSILKSMEDHKIEIVHHGEVDYHVANLDGIRCWPENRTDVYEVNTANSLNETKESGVVTSLTTTTQLTTLPTTTRKVTSLPTTQITSKRTSPSTTTKLETTTESLAQTSTNLPSPTLSNFNKPSVTIFEAAVKQMMQAESFIDSVIEEIPNGVFDDYRVDIIRSLNLENVQLKKIKSNALDGLKNLQELNLNNNAIRSIQQGCFNTLTDLQTLRISHNELSGKLNEKNFTGIGTLLKELDLSFNNIEELEMNCLAHFEMLTSIDLSHNLLSGTLAEQFFSGENSDLKVLDLSFNQIEHIKVNYFSNLAKLESINLSNNRLFKAPSFAYNNDIKYLDLSKNLIKVFDEDTFPTVYEIDLLDLSSNEISYISPYSGFTKSSKIANSRLQNNNFVDIRNFLTDILLDSSPYSGFTKSSKIANLRLQNNNLVDISNFLTEPKLFEISLHNNPIKIISNKFFCQDLKVSGMDLVSVTNISMCNTSTIFDASHNQLSEMPIWTDMRSVQYILLQDNEITNIPVGQFAGCTFLKGLNLDNNKITTLQPGIFTSIKCARFHNVEYLKSLKYLQISLNSLSGTLNKLNFTGLGKSVVELDLSSNNIEVLNDTCFEGLNSISIGSLNLQNNSFKNIVKFSVKISVSKVSLDNNTITGIGYANFCKNATLSNLNLEVIENISMCNTGDTFDASYNKLTNLPKWTEMKTVRIIKLQHNLISNIPIGHFQDCSELVVLNLANNYIDSLGTGVFSGLTTLQSLQLSFNSLPNVNHYNLFGLDNLKIISGAPIGYCAWILCRENRGKILFWG